MDNRYYDSLIGEMTPFFEENNFKALDDGSFVCDTKAVRIEYDEPKQLYVLKAAAVEDGKVGEYSQIDAWLFDDTQNAKDAASVGVGFTASLRENMGIKIKRKVSGEIELPTATKSGSYTMTGFTKKLLDIYPYFKDLYRDHVARYGSYLYLDFLGQYFVPELKTVLNTNDKKQVKKVIDFLGDCFNKGDKETVNAVTAVCAAAIYQDTAAETNFFEAVSEQNYLRDSVKNFIPVFPKNKKLVSLLIKNSDR